MNNFSKIVIAILAVCIVAVILAYVLPPAIQPFLRYDTLSKNGQSDVLRHVEDGVWLCGDSSRYDRHTCYPKGLIQDYKVHLEIR